MFKRVFLYSYLTFLLLNLFFSILLRIFASVFIGDNWSVGLLVVFFFGHLHLKCFLIKILFLSFCYLFFTCLLASLSLITVFCGVFFFFFCSEMFKCLFHFLLLYIAVFFVVTMGITFIILIL